MASAWDPYRDNLIQSGNVEKVAIYGLDGGLWTSTPGFSLSPQELNHIINGFKNQNCLAESGVRVGGAKYMFICSDDCQIQCKKGQDGLSIAKSAKCVIVGAYGKDKHAGNARQTVEAMATYLKGLGY